MKFLIPFIFLLSPIASYGETHYGDAVVSEVSTIYDGDTFFANIKDWPPIVGEHIGVRVNGVDTPEMKGDCDQEIKLARKAKQFTAGFLRSAKKVELRRISRDKYFRIDAEVYGDGKSLAIELIKNGLGYEYRGDTKKSWCN